MPRLGEGVVRLTPAQQALALTARPLVERYCHGPLTLLARKSWGAAAVEQEAWVAVCRAAAKFDATNGRSWEKFVGRGIYVHLKGLFKYLVCREPVWGGWPADGGGEWAADRRPPPPGYPVDPKLAAWCGTAPARLGLTPFARLVLYLRHVEGWGPAEIAAAWGESPRP